MWKKVTAKTVAWIAAVIVTLTVAVSATVAYLNDKTDALENVFDPVFVSCEVQGDLNSDVKADISVKNTGDISAYVRAFLLVSWVSNSDGSTYAGVPKENVDYKLTVGSEKWELGSDGFYYYEHWVYQSGSTEALIGELKAVSEAPDGYSLTVQVFTSAIQAEPIRAVEETWGVTILADGTLLAP